MESDFLYETERLLLKVIDKEYRLEVIDYYKRNIEFLKPWEEERKDMFYTEWFQKIQLNKDLSDIKKGKLLRLWIFKKNEERLIGNIVFSNIKTREYLSCTLGYKLDKEEINKGYITESLTKAIDIVFNDYKFREISAKVIVRNKASLRVLEKLGFKKRAKASCFLKLNRRWEEYRNMVLVNKDMI